MSRKVFALITGITGGVCAIATALVAYFQPAYTPAIVAAIGVAGTAVTEICELFTEKE